MMMPLSKSLTELETSVMKEEFLKRSSLMTSAFSVDEDDDDDDDIDDDDDDLDDDELDVDIPEIEPGDAAEIEEVDPDDDDLALEAKAVCAGCDVRVACLEHALQAREKSGIWGGATERERRRMIRQRRRTA